MGGALDWLVGAAANGQALIPRPEVAAVRLAAELLIALSFLAISIGSSWFLRRRPDLFRQYRLLAWLWNLFILTSGLTVLLGALSRLYPLHGVAAAVAAVAAVISFATMVAMWPILPRLTSIPSPRQLAASNGKLRQEVAAHETTLRELEATRRALEVRVEERTHQAELLDSKYREVAEDLRTALQRYDIALRGSHVTVFTQDRDLRYTSISNPAFGYEVDDIVGRTDDELSPTESWPEFAALKHDVLATGQPKDGEISIQRRGAMRWYDAHIEPLPAASGEVIGLAGAMVDITERKRGEAHLRLLMRELTHRSKNLLAVIQAMARQTARHAGTTDQFLAQFGARLQALATSHDLLVRESWHGASLSDLTRLQVGHYLDRRESPISVDGPPVQLTPEAAQSLGLALHELVNNAAKYGALSVPEGRVAISWRRLMEPARNGVEISWAERDGPSVLGRTHLGFGTLVVEHNLPRALDADVDLEFAPAGLRCRITIPEAHLLDQQ
jgi:PAS domain S-box-containing protein